MSVKEGSGATTFEAALQGCQEFGSVVYGVTDFGWFMIERGVSSERYTQVACLALKCEACAAKCQQDV